MIHRIMAALMVSSVATIALAQQSGLDVSDLNSLDRDGDGAISKGEYAEFANFAFNEMDDDGDGLLSPDEVDDHVVGDAFKILDDDGDGGVSKSEFISQMNDDFEAADKDGDGALN